MGEPEDTTSIVIRSNGNYYGVPKFKIYPPVNGTPDRNHEIEKEGYGPDALGEVEVAGKKGNTSASDTATVVAPVANAAASDTTQTTATPATKITKQQAQQKAVDSDGEEDMADGTSYKVKKNDTLWSIAKNKLKENFGKVSNKQILQYVQQLVNQNNIRNGELIYVGDSLTLPEFDSNTPAYQPPQKQSSKKKKEEGPLQFI